MKIRLLIAMFLITNSLCSQDSHFLDSLFIYDVSQISEINYELQKSELNRLQGDLGISAGIGITNSYQEEIDAGLSTRIYAKMNVLSGGYYNNKVDAEIIRNQIRLDSIQGVDRAVDHNYGIFYDYIISQFNDHKIKVIDTILVESDKLKEYYQTLYYNKLVEYDKLLSITNTIEQYNMLLHSQQEYNRIVGKMSLDTILPRIENAALKIDFDGIQRMIDLDTSYYEMTLMKNEIIDLRHEKEKCPNLTMSLGYDISRRRTFYSVGFSTRLTKNKSSHIAAKKLKSQNDVRLVKVQRKKEIINLQYEYQYKEKQVRGLNLKLEILKEEKRMYGVKKDILSLNESAQEKKLELQKHLIQYEITDLRQQQMLLLLRIKKEFPSTELTPYIKTVDIARSTRKYAGNRFILTSDKKEFSKIDAHILSQNEISPLRPNALIDMQNVVSVDPSDYNTRADMEVAIHKILDQNGESNIIIKSIGLLKELELRTLEQKDYHLTALSK